ncbi:acyl carrier protein [Streptomyces coacervatus]|uniref:Acyl carrier protein n=1 Tax=Streptomyces coacervatus TaxID=647381 RepID=A0ABP7HVP4_9ACTN|nr:acyl carrier protein [Streptomyces coacervatus]MDF2267150.1 acyl carrier protein [Streptomyces coacervatus]
MATAPAPGTRTVDREEIRSKLLSLVASYLEQPVTDIRSDGKLVDYGLDSIFALTLCGDVEDEYGIEVKSTLAWDHPTVDAITEYVYEALTAEA